MKHKSKIPYILLSLLISLMLWFYIVGVQQPEKIETISGIKVVFKGESDMNEDRGLIVSNSKAPTITLTVRGNMIDISKLKTRKDEIIVTADLSGITSSGEAKVAYDVTLPINTVSVLERNPYYIPLNIEKVQTTVVDIVCKNEGSIGEGYLAGEPIIVPETLQVSGPEDRIRSIAYAEVVWTRQNAERTLTSDLEFTLWDENGKVVKKEGISTNFEFITVTVPVQKTKELRLTVDLVEGGGARLENIQYEISPQFITVAGEPDTIDALNSVTVGTLDFAKIISTGEIEYPIILPNDVVNLSGESTCTVAIKDIVGLATKTVTCDNISIINIPKDLQVDIVTQELKVLLRGKAESIELIFANNLRAVADLQNASISEGRYTVGATVFLDGYTDVGIVGEYKIIVEASVENG